MARPALTFQSDFFSNILDAPALRRVGLGHLAGGDSPRGSPWNGCGWAAETLNGVVDHAIHHCGPHCSATLMIVFDPVRKLVHLMEKCMLFLRETGDSNRQKGYGTHQFGRVPCVGEYISLDLRGPHLRVTHVHHTGFGDHVAELYVVEADDMLFIGGEVVPPA